MHSDVTAEDLREDSPVFELLIHWHWLVMCPHLILHGLILCWIQIIGYLSLALTCSCRSRRLANNLLKIELADHGPRQVVDAKLIAECQLPLGICGTQNYASTIF